MAREHTPIQIGIPPEAAWTVANQAPVSYIAFIAGDELPDPGEAFIAAGESFGAAPQGVAPLPVDDERVAWAFEFELPGRSARTILWCESVDPSTTPDDLARDARWGIFIESLLEQSRAVDDAVALAATVARAGRARTLLVFNPDLAMIFRPAEVASLFLSEPRGALVDERHLYRVEVVAHDRERGPFWVMTAGLARVGRPELEILEVAPDRLDVAMQLLDALAARFVAEPVPHAGVPFEAGVGMRLALVPGAEAAETLLPQVPGSLVSRRGRPLGPRAAVCAAGTRGAFRPTWMPPLEALDAMKAGLATPYRAARVLEVRERLARHAWPIFVRLRAASAGSPDERFAALVSRTAPDGSSTQEWIEVDHADEGVVRGVAIADAPDAPHSATSGPGRRVEAPSALVVDWIARVPDPRAPAALLEVNPETAGWFESMTGAGARSRGSKGSTEA